MIKFLIFLLLSFLSFEGLASNTVPLVFIHGFKGAKLVDSSKNIHWLTAFQALKFSTPTLALPLQWTADGQDRDDITAKEVLAEVMLIPGFLGERVYGPWLYAAQHLGAPFYPFSYDWRRDNLETLADFEKFLDHVRSENHVSQIDVVAHSMGGLVTLAILLKRPEIFRKVFFVATPFHGGVGFLPDMHGGTPTGLNKEILSPEVLFSFPSVYTLFPDGRQADTSATLDNKMKPESVDFYKVADWQKNQLGVFALSKRNTQVDLKFLEGALKQARRFRDLLHAPIPKNQPEVTVVLGWKFPTLDKAVHDGPRSVRGWDFLTAAKVPGDGRVGANNLPPEGLKFDLVYSEKDHGNLLNDPVIIKMIGEKIQLNRDSR